jgi:hypothetical protein
LNARRLNGIVVANGTDAEQVVMKRDGLAAALHPQRLWWI